MPDIYVATAGGQVQKLQEIEPNTYAPVVAAAYGGAGDKPDAGSFLITDSTGKYRFDVNSLASKIEYDAAGNQVAITYGPDKQGRYIKQTSTWSGSGQLMGDSAWQLVDASGAVV